MTGCTKLQFSNFLLIFETLPNYICVPEIRGVCPHNNWWSFVPIFLKLFRDITKIKTYISVVGGWGWGWGVGGWGWGWGVAHLKLGGWGYSSQLMQRLEDSLSCSLKLHCYTLLRDVWTCGWGVLTRIYGVGGTNSYVFTICCDILI